MRYRSFYLTMRDGVRIAVSTYLPENLREGARLPTILHQTRYYRSMELRQPLRTVVPGPTFHHIPRNARCRKRFVASGYAWVDVDVRGAGASFGDRVCEWSPDEIRDGAQIVDWIVRQPWSDGKVGAVGTSYNGGAAEFLLANRHPAVRAVAPRFAPFDAYTDIAFPGGVHATWFTETWGRYNAALDRNAPHEVVGKWADLVLTGVQPVQADHDRSLRSAAVAAHEANYDVHKQALSIRFRDDVAPLDPFHRKLGAEIELVGTPVDESGSVNVFSPHNYWRDFQASGAAVYSYSGWFDGAYANAAIKRFLTVSTPGSRLILGPWNHGGGWHVDPAQGPLKSVFDHDAELLRYFDHHLKGRATGIEAEPRVHYFTMIENRWKSADAWPPPAEPYTYHLAPDRRLQPAIPDCDNEADHYVVDQSVGTGEHSRWRTQVTIGEAVRYPDRAAQHARMLTYTSAPLDRALEVTGHPVVRLFVTSPTADGTVFAYLEDVDEQDRVAYVTEGQLRFVNRRLSDAAPVYSQIGPYRTFKRGDAAPLVAGESAQLTFDLLPTSYLFRPGHRIRVALAGCDASHFEVLSDGPRTLAVHRDRSRASCIELPVVTH
ncbi:CocE/NonD family hydrolase [Mycobacterium sp. IS-1496]|uniref:CocE/NonD family hydrolase n=1 Tax=Mycobacterium sp. IS-1496 TaxID=1772284 RepID=UPI0012FCDBE7